MFSPGPPKINIVCCADHQKSIFSFPGAPKINNFSTLTTKLDLKSLFCVSGRPNINVFYPGSPKINILRSQTTKFQYFMSPGHQESIFSVPGHYSSLTHHKSFMYNDSLKINSPKRGGGYAALLRFGYLLIYFSFLIPSKHQNKVLANNVFGCAGSPVCMLQTGAPGPREVTQGPGRAPARI